MAQEAMETRDHPWHFLLYVFYMTLVCGIALLCVMALPFFWLGWSIGLDLYQSIWHKLLWVVLAILRLLRWPPILFFWQPSWLVAIPLSYWGEAAALFPPLQTWCLLQAG